MGIFKGVLGVVLTNLKCEAHMIKRREKKDFCIPTHLTESEALHIVEEAEERGWSNSAYLRHLVKQDQKRRLAELHLSGDEDMYATERNECSVRIERKNPAAVTAEL